MFEQGRRRVARFDPANDSLTRTTLDHVYTPSLAAGDDEVWLTRGDLEGPTGTILRLGTALTASTFAARLASRTVEGRDSVTSAPL